MAKSFEEMGKLVGFLELSIQLEPQDGARYSKAFHELIVAIRELCEENKELESELDYFRNYRSGVCCLCNNEHVNDKNRLIWNGSKRGFCQQCLLLFIDAHAMGSKEFRESLLNITNLRVMAEENKRLISENESLIKELEKGGIRYLELERKYFLVQQQLRLWNI